MLQFEYKEAINSYSSVNLYGHLTQEY